MDPMDRTDTTCIVLCGGTSERFGGGDKTAAAFGSTTVLGHLLDELPNDMDVVCVGDRRPTPRSVQWVREDPPGSGPVAGIAAGLRHVPTPLVAVVAGDMPYAARALPTLHAALTRHPAASAVLAEDPDGHRQLLLGLHRTDALRDAIPENPDGVSVRRVASALEVVSVAVDGLVAADVDTRADLRRLSGQHPHAGS